MSTPWASDRDGAHRAIRKFAGAWVKRDVAALPDLVTKDRAVGHPSGRDKAIASKVRAGILAMFARTSEPPT
jgi:hypothetical protein